MKANKDTARWQGLALTCGIITFALNVEAKKPPKPPPEPPPAAAYDLVLLGDPGSSSEAIDINESGLVLGTADYSRITLVLPEVDNGTLLWHKDADLDGHNDLLVDLGAAAGANQDSYRYPCNINDHGVILGSGERVYPEAEVPTRFAWILPPRLIDGQLTWAALDNDGVNRLITPLPVLESDDSRLEVVPQHINNFGEVAMVIEWFDFETLERWHGGFLLVPNLYDVSPGGAVTIEYPAEDLDGDGFNDSLIDLGMGARVLDGAPRPLLPTVINDRGDVAGMVLKEAGGERPFVLRPRVDENGGLIWNEDNDGDGLNDLVIYLPLPAEVIEAAAAWTGITEIRDMNESGTIVGSVLYGAEGNRAAVWQVDWAAGTVSYAELGPLNRRYDVADPGAVNSAGQIVGRSLRYMRFPTVYQKGWLWDEGNMAPLSDLVPGLADSYSVASGINDSAMIVGAQQLVYPGEWTSFIAVPVAGQ